MSKPKVQSLPHSWLVSAWPETVTPCTTVAGRQLVRSNRAELIECGALCRVGRHLTILGEGYATFLARKMGRVKDYEMAVNQHQSE